MAVTQSPGNPPEHAPPPDGPGAPRVLLVDDDEDIRHLVRMTLERRSDFTVVGEAADGLEAIEQAGELQPDVVLLDIMMPRLSGHEAIPDVLAAAPGTMVVMLSALGAGDYEELSLQAGAHAYVEKSELSLGLAAHLRELLAGFRRVQAGETADVPGRPPH